MEEAVSDAFTLKITDDPVLAILIQIATVSVNENRPVYPNPLHEPVLWRHFRRWVVNGIAAAAKIDKILEEAAKIPER